MNIADSDYLSELLIQRGFSAAPERSSADLFIVNTCSVREHAEVRAKARLRELSAEKKNAANRRLLWVIGCMAERAGESLKKEISGINRLIGAKEIEFIDQHLDSYLAEDLFDRCPVPVRHRQGIAAFVPIMRGCDNYCAYCLVPYVRGREHSRTPAVVEANVRTLVDSGAREITLLGQNVNSYKSEGVDFPDLLARLHTIEGLARVRFTTSHPKDCSQKLIETAASLPKICKHFHLPVQSGSSRILSLMNRQYSRDDYLRLIDAVRSRIPSVDITTDVMVGFPGETAAEYQETLDLFTKIRFTSAFMFAYSPRQGTAACDLPGDVPEKEKKERLNELIAMQTAITKEHFASMTDRTVEVLITGRQSRKDRLWMGQDNGAKNILLACDQEISGMILQARVIRTTGMTLVCERI